MTYSTGKLTYWTALEVHAAIAVACVMTLKPLIVRLFPGFLDPRVNNSSGSEAGLPGQPTAASSEPPLTVGRRPCRMQPLSWIEVRGGVGEQQLQQLQQQQPASGPGPTTTTTTKTAGDVASSEIPVSGRERYSQFLNPSFPLSKGRKSSDGRPSSEIKTKTTTTTTSYDTTRTSAESIKAHSDTTSVSTSYREEDLSSTADLKGLVHVHSEDVSVRTGMTGESGPEQAVRSM